MGRINNIRVPFSVDVGIDDIIVPEPLVRSLSTRLEGFEPPEIYTYSLESTISEKFDAILQRMETTSRMKDFFDIYYLSSVFDFSGRTLKEAVLLTARHRGRILESDAFYAHRRVCRGSLYENLNFAKSYTKRFLMPFKHQETSSAPARFFRFCGMHP